MSEEHPGNEAPELTALQMEDARRAASSGDPRAMTHLARLLRQSSSCEANIWARRADKLRQADERFLEGIALETSNLPEALSLFRAAGLEGHSPAMERLAWHLLRAGENEEALVWYRAAGELGRVTCMERVGRLLLNVDRDQSIRWSTSAAEAGSVAAMRNLAAAWRYRDWNATVEWLNRACQAGDQRACEQVLVVPKGAQWYRYGGFLASIIEKLDMKIGRRKERKLY